MAGIRVRYKWVRSMAGFHLQLALLADISNKIQTVIVKCNDTQQWPI